MNVVESPGGIAFHTGNPGTSGTAWDCLFAGAGLRPWRLPGRGTLVVVSPHPDDETLGAGGIIHDLSARGWRVKVLAVTDGEAAYGRDDPSAVETLSHTRRLEQSRALAVLAPRAELVPIHLPDGEIARFAPALEAALVRLAAGASLLLATWRRDRHPDHEACGAVAARVAAEHRVPLVEFPVWAWHWGTPSDVPVDRARAWRLSDSARQAKRQALAVFASQTAPADRHPVLPPHVMERFRRPVEVVFL